MILRRKFPLWFLACTAIGTLVGTFIVHNSLEGATWGILIGLIPVAILLLVGSWVGFVVRDHPKCRCGSWKSSDYECLEQPMDAPAVFDYRCRCCGRTYRHREEMCFELDGEGKETPYMIQNALLRWRPVPNGNTSANANA